MLLRLRVRLPDRPGSLGQVARTLGVTGADIVQMVVLERVGGRAVDDFTVIWPAAAPADRILAGLAAIPGVAVEGVWRSVGAPAVGGADAELVGQVAANPSDGVATLVDAVPGLLSADWAAALVVPADWAGGGDEPAGERCLGAAATSYAAGERCLGAAATSYAAGERCLGAAATSYAAAGGVAYASWRAPEQVHLPDVTPLRPRAFDGAGEVRYATAPFGRAGTVLLVARGGVAGGGDLAPAGAGLCAPAFHMTEVDRMAQLVRASGLVLGDRLDLLAASMSGVAR